MPRKRKAQAAAPRAAKRKAVASQSKVLAAVKEKANLSAAEADSLDYKEYNESKLVLFENVSPKGFESSAYDAGCKGLYYVLEKGKLMCVEAVDRLHIESIAHFFFCNAVSVTLGNSIRLTPDGSEARYAPLVFIPGSMPPLPPESLGSTLQGDEWPNGVMSYAASRTLPEHFDDGVALLNASADGGMGKGIRFYLGIHEYLGAGQLVAFVLERQKVSATDASSSTSSSNSGVRIVMHQAVSCGTTALSPTSVEVIKKVIAIRGGEIKGVGINSGAACDRLGIPEYQLFLPAEMVFDEDPIPRCFPSLGLRIDLFRLQAALLRRDYCAGRGNDFVCRGCQYCR